MIKVYVNGEQTGVYRYEGGEVNVFNVGIEAMTHQFDKDQDFELVEQVKQIRERELGNGDQAYITETFKGGKYLQTVEGANFQ